MGGTDDDDRGHGMGIVVDYAGQKGKVLTCSRPTNGALDSESSSQDSALPVFAGSAIMGLLYWLEACSFLHLDWSAPAAARQSISKLSSTA